MPPRFAFVDVTLHAGIRMKERRVTDARVMDILENPTREFRRGEHNVAYRALPRRRGIEVVFVEVERDGLNGARVITVIRRAGVA